MDYITDEQKQHIRQAEKNIAEILASQAELRAKRSWAMAKEQRLLLQHASTESLTATFLQIAIEERNLTDSLTVTKGVLVALKSGPVKKISGKDATERIRNKRLSSDSRGFEKR